jgi:hypothetical protein
MHVLNILMVFVPCVIPVLNLIGLWLPIISAFRLIKAMPMAKLRMDLLPNSAMPIEELRWLNYALLPVLEYG